MIEIIELVLLIAFLVVGGYVADKVVEPWLERRDVRRRSRL